MRAARMRDERSPTWADMPATDGEERSSSTSARGARATCDLRDRLLLDVDVVADHAAEDRAGGPTDDRALHLVAAGGRSDDGTA